jgi:hypothetical protein
LAGTVSGDDMKASLSAGLYLMQEGIAPRPLHQLVMSAILYNASALDRDDSIGMANGRKPMGDNENRSPLRNLAHVALDDVFALIVERAGGLIEDLYFGIGDKRTRNRNSLPLSA